MRPLAVSATLGLLVPSVALADHPVGSIVNNGALIDVNEDGFSLLTDMVASQIPPEIAIPDFQASDSTGCLFGDCLYAYDISTHGMWVQIELDDLTIVPGTDSLTLHADATVYLNSASDPADLDMHMELVWVPIDDTCTLYMDPIHLTFDVPITLNLVPDPNGVDVDGDGTPDTKRLDAVIPTPVWNWDATSDSFNFGGCTTADIINSVNDVLSIFGLDLYQLILDDAVQPSIDAVVDSIPGEVEPLLEDLFSSLVINEVVDLGVPLDLTLWPNAISITPPIPPSTPGAVRIAMSSAADVPVSPCVADYVSAYPGSKETPSSPPPVGDTGGVGFAPQISAFIDDDLVNNLLYSAWAGGLLCYDLRSDDPTLALPIPLDTTLLTLIAPGVFDAFFPTAQPMSILLDPKQPPVEDPSGPHDLDIQMNDLGLGFIADIDGRRSRLFQVDVDADAGVDLQFDPYTGNTTFGVDLSGDSFVANVTYNELAPDANASIEGQFSTLFDLLIGPIVDSSVSGLYLPPTTFEDIGLLQMEVAQTGPSGDWVGAYTEAGTVPYDATGCDAYGYGTGTYTYGYSGCDTSGCTYGCSSTGGNVAWMAFPLVVAALRRRKS